MAERSHLSIGEVLSLLREEFPDVTISKIRFLESQGLVDPERTPSGYRKFYDHDVERLRWILRQQRENFLPLKIIRGRLTEQGEDLDDSPAEEAGPGVPSSTLIPADATVPAAGSSPPDDGSTRASASAYAAPARSAAAPPPDNGGTRIRSVAASSGSSDPTGDAGSTTVKPGTAAAALATARPTVAPPKSVEPDAGDREAARLASSAQLALGEDAETFSAEELAHAAGGTPAIVSELQQYGLITPRVLVGGLPYFDAGALEVVKAAAGFAQHGVEARHLRAWRNAADREAGLFEQVILPLLRQRNPRARQQAAATLAELASLGADLRKALLEQALRQIR